MLGQQAQLQAVSLGNADQSKMSGIKYVKKMCAIVIKSKDDKDGCLQFCSNPQRKAAITWPAGDKYIFLANQAIQRTSSKSLATQTAVHLHN